MYVGEQGTAAFLLQYCDNHLLSLYTSMAVFNSIVYCQL